MCVCLCIDTHVCAPSSKFDGGLLNLVCVYKKGIMIDGGDEYSYKVYHNYPSHSSFSRGKCKV